MTFKVMNLSDRPIALLGAEGYCLPWWRSYGVDFPDSMDSHVPVPTFLNDAKSGWVANVYGGGFPIRIPPGISKEISLKLRVRDMGYSGEFMGDVILYSDAPGCEQTQLRINGRVVQPLSAN